MAPNADGHGTDAAYIREAFELAREAVEAGNTPFGSLLVVDDEVVERAYNTTVTDEDIAAHPELTLARWAARELAPDERARCTMYTSTEPCAMCAAGIVYAGLDRVVFSVAGGSLAGVRDEAGLGIPCEEVVERANADVTVEGPVLEDEGLAIHRDFYG